MNVKMFAECGRTAFGYKFTDDEIRNQIKVLRCVIAYLDGRKGSELIVARLRCDLDVFEYFKKEREARR